MQTVEQCFIQNPPLFRHNGRLQRSQPYKVHRKCPDAHKFKKALEMAFIAGRNNKCLVKQDPIWKRRGAKPITPLKLDNLICCSMDWAAVIPEMESLMQIVYDSEWVTRKDYFEVHSTEDVVEGVVINPPSYPAWYHVETSGKTVPAQFPYCTDLLLAKARILGFSMQTAIDSMGSVAAEYSKALINPKKRSTQEVLILAGRIWQGTAAIHAACKLKAAKIQVSVYVHGGTTRSPEELEFLMGGGTIYRNVKDLKGKKFRVVIIALEDQHMGRTTILPMFGEWLQHSVAVFIDPPVLKCSYTSALQVACRGAYNISQKTVIFVPSLPKSYVVDNFIDYYVVDIGVPPEAYTASGMERFDFRSKNVHFMINQIIPQPFTVKGSKIYFYKDGEQVL